MIPTIIKVDSRAVDFYGKPLKGANIFKDHILVHPTQETKVVEGLKAMFGDRFKVEYIDESK